MKKWYWGGWKVCYSRKVSIFILSSSCLIDNYFFFRLKSDLYRLEILLKDTEGLHLFDEGGEIYWRSKILSKPSVVCNGKCQNLKKPVFLEGKVKAFSFFPEYRSSSKNPQILCCFFGMATQRFTSFYSIIFKIFNIFSNLSLQIL